MFLFSVPLNWDAFSFSRCDRPSGEYHYFTLLNMVVAGDVPAIHSFETVLQVARWTPDREAFW